MTPDNHSHQSIDLPVRVVLLVFSLMALFIFLPVLAVQASTWTVCDSGCDYTTIKGAIQNASDGNTILISDTIHTEGSVIISKNLTIEGLGRDVTIWQAAESPSTSNNYLLNGDFNKTVTLRNMTLRHGGSNNLPYPLGTISFLGPSTLENLLVTKNYTNLASTVQGGAIGTQKPMTVTHCIISENIVSSDSSAFGGGISSNMGGSLLIKYSSIINNISRGNFKETGPGVSAYGGGIFTTTPTRIENSLISGNLAKGGNVTTGTGGDAYGGGIMRSTLTVPVNIINTTISNNAAVGGNGETSGVAQGGGLHIYKGTLNFVTVYSNSVTGDLAGGGGLYSAGASYDKPAIQNSIVAHNSGPVAANGIDVYGFVNSQDYNLIEATQGYTMTGITTHNISFDPQLSPLADNGGETLTHQPQVNSPVVNAVPSGVNGCTPGSTIDQTSKARPIQSGCEMGAYELPWLIYLPFVCR